MRRSLRLAGSLLTFVEHFQKAASFRSSSSPLASPSTTTRFLSRPSPLGPLSQNIAAQTRRTSSSLRQFNKDDDNDTVTRTMKPSDLSQQQQKQQQQQLASVESCKSFVSSTTINPKTMRACGVCRGEGQTTSRKRRRTKKRQKNDDRLDKDRGGTEDVRSPPPSEPPSSKEDSMVPCKKCGGSGILPFPYQTNANTNTNSTSPTRSPWVPKVNPRTHIGIIGGGIGGLALAIACQHRNIPYTIYERDLNVEERKEGYGLTMQQGGRALLALGLRSGGTSGGGGEEERLYGRGIHSKRHRVHRPDGTLVGEWGMRKWGRPESKTQDSKRQNVHVARQELRRLLYDHVEGGDRHIRWGHKLVDYRPCDDEENDGDEGSLTLTFQIRDDDSDDSRPPRTATHTVTTLVGADGIRSAVRKNKMGDALSPLRYLGCIVVLGIAPSPPSSSLTGDGETAFQTADGTTRLYAMPFSKAGVETAGAARFLAEGGVTGEGEEEEEGRGETMWQLSFPVTEDEAKELSGKGAQALKEEALRRCGTWHDPIPELLGCTPNQLVTGYPVYDRDILPDELFRTGSTVPGEDGKTAEGDTPTAKPDGTGDRVTLIGDAAHPMSPFKGQGANQALLDAVALARAIFGAERILPSTNTDTSTSTSTHPNSPPVATIENALAEFESGMLRRSAAKVRASAAAAKFLHSDVAIVEGDHPRQVRE